ncbi:MAG TPA: hypothetical protein VGI22_25630, partial [Xanthobacteraceae bacterium]
LAKPARRWQQRETPDKQSLLKRRVSVFENAECCKEIGNCSSTGPRRGRLGAELTSQKAPRGAKSG